MRMTHELPETALVGPPAWYSIAPPVSLTPGPSA